MTVIKGAFPSALIIAPETKVGLWVGCDAILDITVEAWAALEHFPTGTQMKITIEPIIPPQNGDNQGVHF